MAPELYRERLKKRPSVVRKAPAAVLIHGSGVSVLSPEPDMPDGTDHLWVPTTWAVLPDQAQPVLGVKRCGIVSLAFGPGTPAPEFVAPPGLGQLMVTRDLPDPYHPA